MKRTDKNIVRNVIIVLFAIVFTACINPDFDSYIPENEQQNDASYMGISDGFNWKSITSVTFEVSVLDLMSKSIEGAYFECYEKNPYSTSNQGVTTFSPQASNKMSSAFTNNSGRAIMQFTIPTFCDTFYLVSRYAGLPKFIEVPITASNIAMKLYVGGGNTIIEKSSSANFSTSDYITMGNWGKYGKPNYILKDRDVITGTFLNKINKQFPEYVDITSNNSDFYKYNKNITLNQSTELYVTFLHEGMMYQNMFGYFCYNSNERPESVDQIKDKVLIYPYVKSTNSANYLKAGEKIKLQYYNPATRKLENSFPKGVSICWFLNVQGYSNNQVNDGKYQIYSLSHLNTEAKSELKQHSLFVYDSEERKYILGFEEMNRELPVCDNDFNDMLVVVSSVNGEVFEASNPVQEVELEDSDGDGVPDNLDQMPANKDRAFANYFPSKDIFGTLAFEDLWPYKGDYDFNDLVVDYNIMQIANANNDIVALEMKLSLRAIGAGFKNGFGIELPVSWNLIESVKGYRLTENYVTLNSNGTEAMQDNAVIIVFDNAFGIMQHPGSGAGINTDAKAPKAKLVELNIVVTFTEPISANALGSAPFNPFLIKDGDRGVEIHLPNGLPTNLVDKSNFGLGNDNSDPASNRYYVASGSLPWALNLPRSFNYPIEKEKLDNVYLRFLDWAKSDGKLHADWYLENAENTKKSLIYSK